MGKKGKGGAKAAAAGNQKKNKVVQESKEDFMDMLNQLKSATENNTALVAASKTETKKERKDKLALLRKENEEKAQEEVQRRQQVQRFMELLKKQVATQQSDYLEVPKTDKEVDEKADDLVTASAVWMQGWRRSQEDAHIVQLPEDGLGVYSVFDGHSGATVSAYAADHFVEVLKATDGFKARDFEKALPLAFMKLDSDIREAKLDAGTTATVVVVDHEKNKIYCANAGDSRAVMCVGGKCVALSEDHKPNAEVEQTRIEAAGGTVEDASGVPRVNGMLAVSRGFGDFKFKDNEDIPAEAQAVTALPDVTTHDLTDDVQFIVVACDGIWDCLESHQVVEKMLAPVNTAENVEPITQATKDLFMSILAERPQMYGADNMSMVTMRFNKNCSAANVA